MYFAFDTETTSLPRYDLHLAHPEQPHLIQFAGIVFDENGSLLDKLTTLVIPGPGADLSPQAFRAHGISLEQATENGIEPYRVFRWFKEAVSRCELIIGHNVRFDIDIMRILSARLTDEDWRTNKSVFCTMRAATSLVGLPPTLRMLQAGRSGHKAPTLQECTRHFFGEDLLNAHNAEDDVLACIKVFHKLQEEIPGAS